MKAWRHSATQQHVLFCLPTKGNRTLVNGTSYNLGDLPGQSLQEAADVIASETPLRTIPRLPGRGLGSDAIATTLSMIPELPIEKGPRSWRLTPRPQILSRRVWDRRTRDLDTIEELWGQSPQVQFVAVGPFSLATRIELSGGHLAVTDPGALRDLCEAYIEGLVTHATDIQRRLGADVALILEEPDLNSLAQGTIKGTSDFDVIPKIFPTTLGERLHGVIAALHEGGIGIIRLNQLGSTPRVDIARIAVPDVILLSRAAIRGTGLLDDVGQAISEGIGVGIGSIGSRDFLDEQRENPRRHAVAAARLFDELAISREDLSKAEIIPGAPLTDTSLLAAARALACARVANEMLAKDAGDL